MEYPVRLNYNSGMWQRGNSELWNVGNSELWNRQNSELWNRLNSELWKSPTIKDIVKPYMYTTKPYKPYVPQTPQKGTLANLNDPYEINSIWDALISGLVDPIMPNRKQLQKYDWGGAWNKWGLALIPALTTHFNENYIKPTRKGDIKATGLNLLVALGQDVDLFAKLVKPGINVQYDPRYRDFLAEYGDQLTSSEQDAYIERQSVPKRFKKAADEIQKHNSALRLEAYARAYGFSQDGGVHNYDYNVEAYYNTQRQRYGVQEWVDIPPAVEFIANMGLEVATDPSTYFGLVPVKTKTVGNVVTDAALEGAQQTKTLVSVVQDMAEQAGNTALINSQGGFKATAKHIIKNNVPLGTKVIKTEAPDTVSRITVRAIKAFVRGEDKILKAIYSEIISGPNALKMLRNGSLLSYDDFYNLISKAVIKSENAVNDITLSSLSKIVKPTLALERVVNQTALLGSPVGAVVGLWKTGAWGVNIFQSRWLEQKFKKALIDPHKLDGSHTVNPFKYADIRKSYQETMESLPDNTQNRISANVPETLVSGGIYEQVDEIVDELLTISKETKFDSKGYAILTQEEADALRARLKKFKEETIAPGLKKSAEEITDQDVIDWLKAESKKIDEYTPEQIARFERDINALEWAQYEDELGNKITILDVEHNDFTYESLDSRLKKAIEEKVDALGPDAKPAEINKAVLKAFEETATAKDLLKQTQYYVQRLMKYVTEGHNTSKRITAIEDFIKKVLGNQFDEMSADPPSIQLLKKYEELNEQSKIYNHGVGAYEKNIDYYKTNVINNLNALRFVQDNFEIKVQHLPDLNKIGAVQSTFNKLILKTKDVSTKIAEVRKSLPNTAKDKTVFKRTRKVLKEEVIPELKKIIDSLEVDADVEKNTRFKTRLHEKLDRFALKVDDTKNTNLEKILKEESFKLSIDFKNANDAFYTETVLKPSKVNIKTMPKTNLDAIIRNSNMEEANANLKAISEFFVDTKSMEGVSAITRYNNAEEVKDIVSDKADIICAYFTEDVYNDFEMQLRAFLEEAALRPEVRTREVSFEDIRFKDARTYTEKLKELVEDVYTYKDELIKVHSINQGVQEAVKNLTNRIYALQDFFDELRSKRGFAYSPTEEVLHIDYHRLIKPSTYSVLEDVDKTAHNAQLVPLVDGLVNGAVGELRDVKQIVQKVTRDPSYNFITEVPRSNVPDTIYSIFNNKKKIHNSTRNLLKRYYELKHNKNNDAPYILGVASVAVRKKIGIADAIDFFFSQNEFYEKQLRAKENVTKFFQPWLNEELDTKQYQIFFRQANDSNSIKSSEMLMYQLLDKQIDLYQKKVLPHLTEDEKSKLAFFSTNLKDFDKKFLEALDGSDSALKKIRTLLNKTSINIKDVEKYTRDLLGHNTHAIDIGEVLTPSELSQPFAHIMEPIPQLTAKHRFIIDRIKGNEIVYATKLENSYANILLASDARFRKIITDMYTGKSVLQKALSLLYSKAASKLTVDEKTILTTTLKNIEKQLNVVLKQDNAFMQLIDLLYNNIKLSEYASPEVIDAVFSSLNGKGTYKLEWLKNGHSRANLIDEVLTKADTALYTISYTQSRKLELIIKENPEVEEAINAIIKDGQSHISSYDAVATIEYALRQDHAAFKELQDLLYDDNCVVESWDMETSGLNGLIDDVKDASFYNVHTKELTTYFGETKQYPPAHAIANMLPDDKYPNAAKMSNKQLRKAYDEIYAGVTGDAIKLTQDDLINAILERAKTIQKSGKTYVLVGYNNKAFDKKFVNDRLKAMYEARIIEASGTEKAKLIAEFSEKRQLWNNIKQYDARSMEIEAQGITQLTTEQKAYFTQIINQYIDALPSNGVLIQPISEQLSVAIHSLIDELNQMRFEFKKSNLIQAELNEVINTLTDFRRNFNEVKRSVLSTNKELRKDAAFFTNEIFTDPELNKAFSKQFGDSPILNASQAFYHSKNPNNTMLEGIRIYGYKKIFDTAIARDWLDIDAVEYIDDLEITGQFIFDLQRTYDRISNYKLLNDAAFIENVDKVFHEKFKNTGIGWTTTQEILFLDEELLTTRQKVAVILNFSNDVEELLGCKKEAITNVWATVEDINKTLTEVYGYADETVDAMFKTLDENSFKNILNTTAKRNQTPAERMQSKVEDFDPENNTGSIFSDVRIGEYNAMLEDLSNLEATLKNGVGPTRMLEAQLNNSSFFNTSERVRLSSAKQAHNLIITQRKFLKENAENLENVGRRWAVQRWAQRSLQKQQTLLGLHILNGTLDEIVGHLFYRAQGVMVVPINAYKNTPGFSEAFNSAIKNIKQYDELVCDVYNDTLVVRFSNQIHFERFSGKRDAIRNYRIKKLEHDEYLEKLTKDFDNGKISEVEFNKRKKALRKVLDTRDTDPTYGVHYMYNGKDIIRPDAQHLDFDEAFKMFNDEDHELTTALRATYDKNNALLGDGAIGSSHEIIDENFLDNLYGQLPKNEKALDIDTLRNVLPHSDIMFNHSLLGDGIARRAFFKDTTYAENINHIISGDVFNSTLNVANHAYSGTAARNQYLLLFYEDGLKLNDNSIFKGCTDEEIFESISTNGGFKVAVIYDTGKPSIEGGVYGAARVVEVPIRKVSDIAKARAANAIILPDATFNKLCEVVNGALYTSGFMKAWQRLNYVYKVGWLSRPSTWFKNMLDAYIHNNIETEDPLGMSACYAQAMGYLTEYTKIFKELTELSENGKVSQKTFETYFSNKHTGMNKELFQRLHALYNEGPANQVQAVTNWYLKNRKAHTFKEAFIGRASKTPAEVFIGITRFTMKPNELVEQVARTAEYLWAVKNGFTDIEAYALITKTHYDYTVKGGSNILNVLFPFYNYAINNRTYWLDAITKKPWVMRAYSDYIYYGHGLNNVDYNELQYDRKRLNAIVSGNLVLGDLEIKLNPSLSDFLQEMTNPIGTWKNRLAPYLQYVINAVGAKVLPYDEYNFITGILGTGKTNQTRITLYNSFKQLTPIAGTLTPLLEGILEVVNLVGNIKVSLSQTQNWDLVEKTLKETGLIHSMTVGQFADAMSKVPEAEQGAKQLKKIIDNRLATIVLSALVPGLFNDIYKEPYTPKQYTKKLYSNTKRKSTGTYSGKGYKRKPYNRRPYAKKTYAKKSYTKKSWAKKSYVSNVYARKSYDRKVYAKNLWHNRYQSRQVGLYNRLYTKKGRARLDTLFAPKTKGLQYSIINTNIFYRR